jgi:LAO/AO transport system kinase
MDELVGEFRRGSQRALARAITLCESGRGAHVMAQLYPATGRALTVGLTGPPGVGKSTLCGALVGTARRAGRSVGVISVDPSSPFSHGALLGDRIRLAEHFTDPGVFIRSMASRGHLGGVAGATADAVALMDAFGKEIVIVETVGVGQSEIEITDVADTTIVALQPGSGDSIQVLKAGVLEIADIFVVNKSDHPMALQLQRELRSMLEMWPAGGWNPPLVSTQALAAAGIDDLWAAIEAHAAYLSASGERVRRRRSGFASRVRALALGALTAGIDRLVTGLEAGPDPYAAAHDVLARLGLDDLAQPLAARSDVVAR